MKHYYITFTLITALLAVTAFPAIAQESSWSQVFSEHSPPARHNHAMVYDSTRDVFVLFGGVDRPLEFEERYSEGVVYGDTWESSDGVDWTQVATTGPSSRYRHAMAYDEKRGVTVLFGGRTYEIRDDAWGYDEEIWPQFGDTWEWNGVEWREVLGNSPPAQFNHRMVYDSNQSRVLLFGGGDLDSIWAFNGEWTQIADSTSRKALAPSIAYDSVRDKVVFHGGLSFRPGTVGKPSGDTWEWDDSNGWVLVSSDIFIGEYPVLAYSPISQTVLLVEADGETHEWNGIQWLSTNSDEPENRHWQSLCYNPTRQTALMFGGRKNRGYPSHEFYTTNEVWEYGPEVTIPTSTPTPTPTLTPTSTQVPPTATPVSTWAPQPEVVLYVNDIGIDSLKNGELHHQNGTFSEQIANATVEVVLLRNLAGVQPASANNENYAIRVEAYAGQGTMLLFSLADPLEVEIGEVARIKVNLVEDPFNVGLAGVFIGAFGGSYNELGEFALEMDMVFAQTKLHASSETLRVFPVCRTEYLVPFVQIAGPIKQTDGLSTIHIDSIEVDVVPIE